MRELPNSNANSNSNAIIDTLRIPDRDLLRVLAFLSAKDGGSLKEAIANLPRMLVRICHQTGNCNTYLVKPRDIHRHGICFLHGAFVHTGAQCSVLLRTREGDPTQLAARVIRCRHVVGRIHEIVATFETAIEMKEFQFAGALTLEGTPGQPDALSA